jgi:predicted N-acetyltransferase YhbS
MKEVELRQEKPKDYEAVFDLIDKAFQSEEFSDQSEKYLVEKLRKSDAFIPELSIVATVGNAVVGHILLTKVKIKNASAEFPSLALAPVSVLPKFQNRGIGHKLIERAHQKARKLGFTSVIVLGHENYYPRFGYLQANKFNIELPFNAPKENCMAIELVQDGLKGISGKVEYPKEFA